MDANYFRSLYEYNYWAHDKVWACCETLEAAKFTQPLDYSIGSLHEQWVHVISAENSWFSRLRGYSPTAHLDPATYVDREAIMEKWTEVRSIVRSYLTSLTDVGLVELVTYQNFSGVSFTQPVWIPLMQVVNHGTDHRAQILAMAHGLGARTVEQDWIIYARERLSGIV